MPVAVTVIAVALELTCIPVPPSMLFSTGLRSVGLFEIGKVFFSVPDEDDPRLPAQPDRVAWAVVGDVGTETLGGAVIKADGAV